MKSILIRIVVGGLLLLGGLGVCILCTDRVMPWNKAEAINTTLEWGGLAALPVPVSEVEIKKVDGSFSQKFSLRFKCDYAAQRRWIHSSSGLKNGRLQAVTGEGASSTFCLHPNQDGVYGGTLTIRGQEVELQMKRSYCW
ncbi:hypothetical protein [Hymenobacter sp. 102]|uniref:hypothetical protein n=1 Tax=Hymenobacter sp. 102 TaxID=3403152 RepID=UPI003CE967FD